MLEKVTALLLLVPISPLLVVLYFLIETTSKGDFIFKQKRLGKNKKEFELYKIRTMVDDAEKIKDMYAKLNEVEFPVFKIENDPRFTKIGKLLSHYGLDELPQLINIFKGEMSFVGPRPLPVTEAKLVPKIYDKRFSIKPGITSPWIIKGSHKLNFKEWMELDLEYIEKKSAMLDATIFFETIILMLIKLIKNVLYNIGSKIIVNLNGTKYQKKT